MADRNIKISDQTWKLLQKFAIPFEDTPDDVIQKLARQAYSVSKGRELIPDLDLPVSKKRRGTAGSRGLLPWDKVNWELSNSDIADIWSVGKLAVSNRRANFKHGSARWTGKEPIEGDYLAAREAEVKKVREYRATFAPETKTVGSPFPPAEIDKVESTENNSSTSLRGDE